jgi:hypothetical protein
MAPPGRLLLFPRGDGRRSTWPIEPGSAAGIYTGRKGSVEIDAVGALGARGIAALQLSPPSGRGGGERLPGIGAPAVARVAETPMCGRDGRRFACTGHFFAVSLRLDQAADGV